MLRECLRKINFPLVRLVSGGGGHRRDSVRACVD